MSHKGFILRDVCMCISAWLCVFVACACPPFIFTCDVNFDEQIKEQSSKDTDIWEFCKLGVNCAEESW